MLKRLLPLPRLVRLMWAGTPRGTRDRRREDQIMMLAETLSGPRGNPRLDNCLDRSLIAYRFLSQVGAEPELIMGVAKPGEEVRGHAWVRLDGVALRETDESLEGFEELASFGAAGALTRGAPYDDPATTPSRPDLWR